MGKKIEQSPDSPYVLTLRVEFEATMTIRDVIDAATDIVDKAREQGAATGGLVVPSVREHLIPVESL